MQNQFNNQFTSALRFEGNKTYTENGAETLKSSGSRVLDFYATGAALRTRSEDDILNIWDRAWEDDQLLALKALFYIRDARGGQGERRTFRIILKRLAEQSPETVIKNFLNVVEFGRFDDLEELLDVASPLKHELLKFIQATLQKDLAAERPSLMAKWLPSINTSSAETRRRGRIVAKFLGLSEKDYRKTLSALRAKLNVVERQQCAGQWDEINYSAVPSKAMLLYRKAYAKHDGERFAEFKKKVEKGEAKINAGTLYPYDIVGKVLNGDDDSTLDLVWQALPNYITKPFNGLVMADVSGSMSGLPMAVSISLAMYIAERNQGAYHNLFMTFSESPEIVQVEGRTLQQKVRNLKRAHWEMNTNLQAAFAKILAVAKAKAVPQSEMPKILFVVSDMELDEADSNGGTNFDGIRRQYNEAGYELPTIVFWNVNSRNNHQPVRLDEQGVYLVSGCSPSILETMLNVTAGTPYELMVKALSSDRYAPVTV